MQSISSQSSWQEPDPAAPLSCWRNLIDDALAHISPPNRPRALRQTNWAIVSVAFKSAGLRATMLYRMAHTAHGHLGIPGKVIAHVLSWILRHFYGCVISHRARIYGGLVLPHPQGLVIGPGVVVGPRAWIFQNVTLGGIPDKEGMPWVGADSRLFAGAVVVGPIRVGDNVFIAANTVVASDVPARTMVRPAEAVFSQLPDRFLIGGERRFDE